MQNKEVIVGGGRQSLVPVETEQGRAGWSRDGVCYQIHPTTEEILYCYKVEKNNVCEVCLCKEPIYELLTEKLWKKQNMEKASLPSCVERK